jgi:hypothetical protein
MFTEHPLVKAQVTYNTSLRKTPQRNTEREMMVVALALWTKEKKTNYTSHRKHK